jgi:hypothetical protein
VYLLRLTVDDGNAVATDDVQVSVQSAGAPVGWWTLNEGDGTVAGDATVQGNNGQLSGASVPPSWTDGSLHFEGGQNQVVNIGRPTSLDLRPAATDITTARWRIASTSCTSTTRSSTGDRASTA